MPQDSANDGSRANSETGSSSVGLRQNALGLLSTAALTAAYMGPALSIYALFGPMTEKVGNGVGFVLFLATVLILLSAISFGMLAKEMPSAGGLYGWSTAALGRSAGTWIGLNNVVYFWICLIFGPIIFGQFFVAAVEQVCQEFGVSTPTSSVSLWLVGAIGMMIAAGYVAYRGILVSAHLAFTLLLIELAVVMALAATFIGFSVSKGTFSLTPITFGGCKDGWAGIRAALPMALLCLLCDAAVPAGEETRNARRTIPLAILLTCTMVGIWYVVGFSAFALGHTVTNVPVNEIQNSIDPMAEYVWGRGRILVSLTAMSAALGAFIPALTASSRMIYAMAREGKLPAPLARLNTRFQAPWNAIHLSFAFTLLAILPVLSFGPGKVIEWWSDVEGWFIGLVYTAANFVNIVYYWRFARSQFHPILNFMLPLISIGVWLWIVWQIAIAGLLEKGLPGYTAQAFMLAVSVPSAIYVLFTRPRSVEHASTY